MGLCWDCTEPDDTPEVACLPSVINNSMTSVATYSDFALGMYAMGGLCVKSKFQKNSHLEIIIIFRYFISPFLFEAILRK